ncbi:MAG: LysR substrate-binding domain-containing protein [Paludibacteraceae bacterium]|nr:LysR substrate-binding domain-containing protein [Paludibacteraceae bacterium]
MELRQLRYFLKAAELLNFTDAAKQMYITQSTLSQQIKQLETELNVLLFDRIGKKVFLTEAGNEFLPFAKQTVGDADLAVQRIQDLQGIRTGSLRIGITYSLSFGLAPIILRFMKEYPNIKLEVFYNTAQELLQMLKDRELDFVLSFSMAVMDEQVEETDLYEVPLCAIVHIRHPLAFQKNISLKELKQYSLVLPSRGLSARSALNDLLQTNDIILDPHLEMNDANILLQLVESSLYVTVLSKTTILGRPELRAIPIKEQQNGMMASVLTMKGAYQKASAEAFLKLFEEGTLLK